MAFEPFSSISRKRASTKIQQMKQHILTEEDQSDGLAKSEKVLLNQIKSILDKASDALDNGEADLAWQLLHSAKRIQLRLDSKDTLLFKKNALYYEANKKLKSWRKEAVLDYLDDVKNDDKPVNTDALSEAYHILHEHFNNIYTKNRSILKQLFTLSFTAFTALLLFLAVIWNYNITLNNDLTLTSQMPLSVTFSVLLFGIMGACLSAIFSLAGGAQGINIPKLQVNFWITLSRPVVGAISALVIYIFIVSGILFPNQNLNTAGILSISFVAGFSERLIIRAVETVTDDSKLNLQSKSQKS